MPDLNDVFGGYFHHLANQYYFEWTYLSVGLCFLVPALVPWLGALLYGRRGLLIAAAAIAGILAALEFSWVWSLSEPNPEFSADPAIVTSRFFAVQLAVICLSAWAASRKIRRSPPTRSQSSSSP